MNAADTIQAAIDKLTGLSSKSQAWSPAPWTQGGCEAADTNGNLVADFVVNDDAELIVTLRRTAAAQLKLLKFTLALGAEYAAAGRTAAWLDAIERAGDLDLAKAILGDDEPKQPTEPDPEEHTDRMARHMEEDADIARLNALMGGL